jgi:hypothetical protein
LVSWAKDEPGLTYEMAGNWNAGKHEAIFDIFCAAGVFNQDELSASDEVALENPGLSLTSDAFWRATCINLSVFESKGLRDGNWGEIVCAFACRTES